MSSKHKKKSMRQDNQDGRGAPRLRFPEFGEVEGWCYEPLGALAVRCTARNLEGQHSRVLTNSAEFGVIDQRDFFEKDIATQGNLESYYIVEKGDYVYNPRISATAPVGPISRNDRGTGVMSPLYTVFRFKGNDSDFFAQYFKSAHWHNYIRQTSSTGARHDRISITNDDFMGLPVPVSSPREQAKISDCLSSLEVLISAECRRLEMLQTHRTLLMKRILPGQGQSAPPLRFPVFRERGPWRSTTLAQIAEIRSGSTPSRAEPAFFSGGTIPWVKTTDLNNGFIVRTEECITPAARARVNPAGSVLVAMYGGFKQIGRTGFLTMPAATNQAISVLNTNATEVLPIYLLTWMNARVGDWKRIASSSRKDPNITGGDVAKFPIAYPDKDEQQQIADAIAPLNDGIEAQAKKIGSLKAHKGGLLQQLFPAMGEVNQ